MSKLKNLLLSGAMATTLTACGGGGGGSGAGAVNDFVQGDLSNLSGSSSIVSSYSNLLSTFQSTISGGDFSALQAVITGPDAEDISTAKTLLGQLNQAEDLWAQSETLIDSQSNTNKYKIYNSESYKEAYAAMVYLRDHVKPIITRVSEGKTITLEQLNKVAKEDKAQEIINTEKTGSAVEYANAKQVVSTEAKQSTEETYNQIEDGTPVEDFSNSTWETIEGQGGKEKRTVKVTTPQTKVVKTKTCTWTETTKLSADGTAVTQTTPSCSIAEVKTELSPKVEDVIQYQEGSNPIVTTEILADVVSDTTTEWNSAYGTGGTLTTPIKVSTTANTPEVVAGSESTATVNFQKTRTEATGTKNQVWVIIDNWTRTTITKPAVSTTSDNVVYNDTKTKQKRTWTITTKRKKVTYKDGTSEIIETPQAKVYTDWETVQTEVVERTEKENEVSSNIFLTPDITESFVSQASKTLKNNAYTDDDEDLGTKTVNVSTVVSDHKTSEYYGNHGLNTINAADAYARGWTGKGAVLGVVDTWQQTDHPELDGKYKYYKDYTLQKDTTGDGEYDSRIEPDKTQVHGTHVAGIIAGKNDGNTMHGVAYDAELVGANVDKYANGNIHNGSAQNAVHDFAKLKDPNGENMNIIAINMSINNELAWLTEKKSSGFGYNGIYNVTELSDGTFHAPNVIEHLNNNNNEGQAKYWKAATDNDIILVNSAGNSQYIGDHVPADPGIWATETDANGNLILGGKMIIVGNWDGTGVSGNKAGHVCMSIVDNKCNDTNKISDFYILAPGQDIHSSVPTHLDGNGYMNSSGTSMAAPHVTGALGILHQMWPHMKGENLVKLVLATADKDLTNYDINIHGQGLLDLDEATQPQGAVGIPTTGKTNGPIISVENNYFITGTSLPSSISNLKVMILDEYERDYYVNLGSTMQVKDMRKVADIDMMMNGSTYLPVQSMWGNFTQGGNYDLGYMNFGLYTGENGGGDYSANVGKNFMLHKNFKLKTSIGQMNEQDNWLGNASDGALAVGDNNVTNYGQIGVEYALGSNVISFDYTKGYTDINTTDNSLITGFNDIESESMKVAYEVHKDQHNTWGISLSTPMHITNGNMNLKVPESRTLSGDVNYTDINSDMSTGSIEKNLGFFYNHNSAHELDASWNFKAEYRQDISGIAGNDGVNLGLNYVKKFSGACGFLFWKNPKCYNGDGSKKDIKAMYANQGKEVDNLTKHGLVYDLETDMFVPIKKK